MSDWLFFHFFHCLNGELFGQLINTAITLLNVFRNSARPSINAYCIDDTFDTNHVVDFHQNNRSLITSTLENNDGSGDFLQMIAHLESPESSLYQDNVLYFITGFIVHKIQKKKLIASFVTP